MFQKIPLTTSIWTLLAGPTTRISFQVSGQFPLILLSTSSSTQPSATAPGFIFNISEKELNINPDVIFYGSGTYIWAKAVSGTTSVIFDTESVDLVNTVLPVITGTSTQGQTLSVSNGTWTGTAPITYTYAWRRAGVLISGATSSTYELISTDVGTIITCSITATNPAGSVSATTAGTSAVTGLAPVNTVIPTISGSEVVNQLLTASTGTWTGTPTITYTYAWRRNGSNISGATASTYTLVDADIGAVITVRVTGTNGTGNSFATSAGTGVILGLAPTNTVLPVISGTTTQGQVLTSTTGTWTGTPTPTYAYQWRDDGVDISGATSSTFTLTSSELAGSITCRVTATNTAGSANVTSAAVGPVTGSYTNVLHKAARFDLYTNATGSMTTSLPWFVGSTGFVTDTGVAVSGRSENWYRITGGSATTELYQDNFNGLRSAFIVPSAAARWHYVVELRPSTSGAQDNLLNIALRDTAGDNFICNIALSTGVITKTSGTSVMFGSVPTADGYRFWIAIDKTASQTRLIATIGVLAATQNYEISRAMLTQFSGADGSSLVYVPGPS